MKPLIYAFLFCTVVFSSCSKNKIAPAIINPANLIIGKWNLQSIDGEIDSIYTANGNTAGYQLKVAYDAAQHQLMEAINGNQSSTIPYTLIVAFNDDGTDSVSETYTQPNSASLPTNYAISSANYWNFNTNDLTIGGLQTARIFGSNTGNGTHGAGQSISGTLLESTSPGIAGSYQLTANQLKFYFQAEYKGNNDIHGSGGVVINPNIHITITYTVVFTKVN